MYVLAQHEVWRQRPEEIWQEVSSNRLGKSARSHLKGGSVLGRDLGWELARYAELLGKRLRNLLVLAMSLAALMAAMLLTAIPSYAAGTSFTVDSTLDASDAIQADNICNASVSGARVCTLRAAIEEANANGNPSQVDRIDFDIPGTGVHTISPKGSLPDITEPVVINGYSQPGASVNTLARGTNAKLLIQIDGTDMDFTGLKVAASNSVVKGLVINRLSSEAIEIAPETSADAVTNVRIAGNFLGTDPSGTLARPKGDTGVGVSLVSVSNNTVGGASRASRNLISGNGFPGVVIEGDNAFASGGANDNLVRGNLIGTQKDGIGPLGNGLTGVDILTDEPDATANGNRILSNSIFSNDGLGIDLGDDGPTANDQGDTDSGENDLQNKPSLGSARNVSGKTTIRGSLNSRPGATYTVQFFSNPPGTDEGRTFLGQKTGLTLDGTGKGSFTFSPATEVAVGQTITATATNEFTGDTSEFSAPREVVSA